MSKRFITSVILLMADTASLEALLPNCWVAVHPEQRLEQREEESREAQARRRWKRVIRRAVATV